MNPSVGVPSRASSAAAFAAPPEPASAAARSAPAAPELGGAHRAALLLHGIDAADRHWLLGELAAGQRAVLESMLGELQELGVPPSLELIDDMLSSTPAAPPATLPASEAAPEPAASALARLAPSAVADALRGEPDLLVARALGSTDSAWRSRVLRELGLPRRRRVEEAERSLASSTRSGSALETAIQAALLAAAVAQPTALDRSDGRLSPARLIESLRRLAAKARRDGASVEASP